MVHVAKTRLQNPYVIETALTLIRACRRMVRLAQVVFDWVINQLEAQGKETAHLKAEQK
jgi:hypothetical protein